jgi:hypothetical protein
LRQIRVPFLPNHNRCYGNGQVRQRYETRADLLLGDPMSTTAIPYHTNKDASCISRREPLLVWQGGRVRIYQLPTANAPAMAAAGYSTKDCGVGPDVTFGDRGEDIILGQVGKDMERRLAA